MKLIAALLLVAVLAGCEAPPSYKDMPEDGPDALGCTRDKHGYPPFGPK